MGVERDQYPLVVGALACDLACTWIHKMYALTRGAGRCLILLLVRVNLFGRPPLNALAGIRTAEEKSTHFAMLRGVGL